MVPIAPLAQMLHLILTQTPYRCVVTACTRSCSCTVREIDGDGGRIALHTVCLCDMKMCPRLIRAGVKGGEDTCPLSDAEAGLVSDSPGSERLPTSSDKSWN